MNEDDESLLIACDSLLSLIYYREKSALTSTTEQDVATLLPKLRAATNRITSRRRNGGING